eukprot:UN2222
MDATRASSMSAGEKPLVELCSRSRKPRGRTRRAQSSLTCARSRRWASGVTAGTAAARRCQPLPSTLQRRHAPISTLAVEAAGAGDAAPLLIGPLLCFSACCRRVRTFFATGRAFDLALGRSRFKLGSAHAYTPSDAFRCAGPAFVARVGNLHADAGCFQRSQDLVLRGGWL